MIERVLFFTGKLVKIWLQTFPNLLDKKFLLQNVQQASPLD
jgi:hypothetical protein